MIKQSKLHTGGLMKLKYMHTPLHDITTS